ncbi:MAG: T9SS type A sorting domain-containing protein [Ignavibacteria bacterium]|nr:T9SS type A sorting domain-containing protein [Ignavibacteria bacterium]
MKKLLLLVVFFGLSTSIFSQWSTDPLVNNAVNTTTGNQQQVATCPDGAGGIIMAWTDVSTAKIYAQRVNAFGQAQWGASGIPISGNTGDHMNPCICSDAGGGAIIGWKDSRNGTYDVYAQRVRVDGLLMWTPGGVRVSSSVNDIFRLKCIGAEAGYAIFAWNCMSGTPGLFAQKVDAFGARLWNVSDLRISFFATNSFDMCKDAAKGVYFSYSMPDTTSDGWQEDIFAQHVTAMGDTLWNIHHCINHDTLTQYNPSMCEDQDYGFIVAWEDFRHDTHSDIYAQRVDSARNKYWGSHGKAICTHGANQTKPYCISDAHSGAHIVWLDDRSQPVVGGSLYGQNINHNGQTQWTSNGKRIAYRVDDFVTADGRNNPQVASVDALGGLIACWIGYYDDALTQYGVLVQRIDYYGNTMWDANGVFVSKGGLKKGPSMVFDGGMSGCNVAWADGRNFGFSGYDVYAQHIKSNAGLGNRPSNNQGNGQKTSSIKQNFPNPFNPATKISFTVANEGFISLKIYDMTGREIAVLANGVYTEGEYSVNWDARNFATGAYLYKFVSNEKTEIKTMMLVK